MKIELTDEEWATVLVALDGYAGSAEWVWQKIYGAIATERNATAVEAVKVSLKGELAERNTTADAIGEGATLTNTLIDPFGLPTWSDT